MVLKEFEILHKHHKLVILGAMAIGVIYPFFTDFSIFGLDSPKFIAVGLLLIGMLLFWELYGDQSSKHQAEYKQRASNYPTQQHYSQPNQPIQHGSYTSNYEDRMFNEANIPPNPEGSRFINPVYHPPKPQPRHEPYFQTPTEEQETDYYEEPALPRVSDVIKRKVKLPDRVPPPKGSDSTPQNKNRGSPGPTFKKFGS